MAKSTKFKAGKSGNPKGRPSGSKGKATMAAKALLDGEVEILTRKAIEMAKNGDPVAMRLCMERIYPKPKESIIKAKLPEIKKAGNIPQAIAEIFHMIGKGEITIDQGKSLTGIVVSQGNILEMTELEKRIAALEEKNDFKIG